MPKEAYSVTTRFLWSVGASVLKAALSLCTGLIIARGLGPENFGNLAYLLGSFWAIRALLDAGTSSAFFTFIAQSRRARSYYLVYFCWLVFQFVVTASLVAFLLPDNVMQRFWIGQARGVVLLAFLATFLQNQVWQTVVQLHESVRKTTKIQLVGVLIASGHLVIVAGLLGLDLLCVEAVLCALIAEYTMATIFLCATVTRSMLEEQDPRESALADSFLETVNHYVKYCRPLLVIAAASFVYEMTDRWFLQRFGGSIQQGFYQVAYQLSTISVLATTSILNVLWKEVAEANALGNSKRTFELYRQATTTLQLVAIIVACFLAPWSKELVHLLLGESYQNAWPVLLCMLLYPIHQAVGQINGTFMLATGRNSVYMRVSVLGLLACIPISAWLLAPIDGEWISGLGLGGLGLAIKMLGMNFLFVNLQTWIIFRSYGRKMEWLRQVSPILSLLLLSCGIRSLVLSLNLFEVSEASGFDYVYGVGVLVVSAILYATAFVAILSYVPVLIGVNQDDLTAIIQKVRRGISGSRKPSQQNRS